MEKKYNDELKHRNMLENAIKILQMLIAIFLVFNFIISPLFNFKIRRYTFTSSRIFEEFDGYKLVQISDLYLEKDTDLAKLSEELVKLNPDLITFTGNIFLEEADDYFKNLIDMKKYLDEVLDKKLLVYISKGETDLSMDSDYQKDLYKLLERNEIYLLDNRSSVINRAGKSIFIHGVTPSLEDYKLANDITSFNPVIRKDLDRFSLALSHNPSYGIKGDLMKMDLILAGSRNGGWIRLPFIKGLDYGLDSIFKEGLYKLDADTSMLVSRGAGTREGKLRIFNPRELVLIELKRGS